MTTFSAGNSRSRSSRTYENTEVVFCLKTNATNNIVCTKLQMSLLSSTHLPLLLLVQNVAEP